MQEMHHCLVSTTCFIIISIIPADGRAPVLEADCNSRYVTCKLLTSLYHDKGNTSEALYIWIKFGILICYNLFHLFQSLKIFKNAFTFTIQISDFALFNMLSHWRYFIKTVK